MSDIIEIEWEGTRYICSRPSEWTIKGEFVAAPTGIVAKLNCRVVERNLSNQKDVPDTDLATFVDFLRSFGATEVDFEKPGLERLLAVTNPEGFRRRRFEDMPPPAHTPFNCVELRNWLFESSVANIDVPSNITCVGSGPFEQHEFEKFHRGFIPRNELDVLLEHYGGSRECSEEEIITPTGHLILGRQGWDKRQIDEIIDQHHGQQLRIYSQEMFVCLLLTRRDPFTASPDILAAFRSGHPGLEFVSEGWSGWVKTDVSLNWRQRSIWFDAGEQQEESPLHKLGYRVGRNGLAKADRQAILARAFDDCLPDVGTPEYMASWGEPNSTRRLQKMADHIAQTCRSSKGKRNASYAEAIADWESDLEWLQETYYHGHFTFSWPNTDA